MRVDLIPVLVAIGAAAAAHTAFLPWLPSLVDASLGGQTSGDHDTHVALLSAIFPLGGMVTAPLWGWLSDRSSFRSILVFVVALLAIATASLGSTSLELLYLLRLLAGVSFGAIVPLCLLVGNLAAESDEDKARLFTMLTASLFLGDFAGPLLAEASARIWPELPLFAFGLGVGAVALAIAFARSPAYYWRAAASSGNPAEKSSLFALLLLGLAVVGSGGLSVVHLDMALHRSDALSGREQMAWMLSLCGLAMLFALVFHAKLGWLVTRPAFLAASMLILLGVALWLFSGAQSRPMVAAAIFAAGWSAATLRLVASFWISASRNHSGARLGVQHAAASVGQVAVPLAAALSRTEWHSTVLWATIAACLILLLGMRAAWQCSNSPAGHQPP